MFRTGPAAPVPATRARRPRGDMTGLPPGDDELEWLSPLLAVFVDTPLFRLQAGPYASREEARDGAERIREALQLVPVIVERK